MGRVFFAGGENLCSDPKIFQRHDAKTRTRCGFLHHSHLTAGVGERNILESSRNIVATLDSGGLWGTPYDLSDRRQSRLSQPRRWDDREYQHPLFWLRLREILPVALWM